MKRLLYCCAGLLCVCSALQSQAAIITVPPLLAPGTQYRLAFVTNGVILAASTDIATYNSFVDSEGDAVLSSDWRAIASTAAVDARDNTGTTGTGVAIYDLVGNKIADDYGDLWDGSLDNPINVTPTEAAPTALVWTGTGTDGIEALGLGLGISSTRGNSGNTDANWVSSGSASGGSISYRLYGISGLLTVPLAAAVPEPSSFIALSLVGLCGWYRRRNARVSA